MSAIVGLTAPPGETSIRGPWSRAATWLSVLLVFGLAVLIRGLVVANTDVSWLLTLGERVLDGQRPYVDFIEFNSPAALYLYVPGIAVARLLGLSPEFVTDALVFAVLGASLWISARIVARTGLLAPIEGGWVLICATVILTVLPAQTFGEREHIAVAMFLPMLSVLQARAHARMPDLPALVAAGLGAGLTVVVKPHLALGFAAALAVTAYAARSWAALIAFEVRIAAAVIALYAAVVVFAFPHFLADTMPLARDLYVPIRMSFSDLMFGSPAIPIWILTLVALAVLRRRQAMDDRYAILLAGSAGFAAAFLIQGKGWPYHSYPMLTLGLLALAVAIAERRRDGTSRAELGGWVLLSGAIWFGTFAWMNLATTLDSLVAPIRQIKAHPTMLAITHDIAIGHPLVREVEGTWVGPVPCLWITAGAKWRLTRQESTAEERARLERYIAFDRGLLIDALRRRKPDVILIQKEPSDWVAWARADREIADLLRSYSEAVTTNEILVLKRRDIAGLQKPG